MSNGIETAQVVEGGGQPSAVAWRSPCAVYGAYFSPAALGVAKAEPISPTIERRAEKVAGAGLKVINPQSGCGKPPWSILGSGAGALNLARGPPALAQLAGLAEA